jgi:hypothetical protein
MAQKCRFSLAGCPSSLRTGDIYTHCLHGFKSTIIDGPSYVTSYDTQPNAVAPSVRADKNHLIAPVCLLSVPFSHEKPDHDLICQARLGTRSQKETPQLRTAFFLSQDSPPGDVSAFGIDPAVLAAKERGVFFDVGHGQGAGNKAIFPPVLCAGVPPPWVVCTIRPYMQPYMFHSFICTAGSFSWTVAEVAARDGFFPDTISTDIHLGNSRGPCCE